MTTSLISDFLASARASSYWPHTLFTPRVFLFNINMYKVQIRGNVARDVPIYWIGKISAANMAKYAISEIGIFEIVQIYLPIFAHAPNNF